MSDDNGIPTFGGNGFDDDDKPKKGKSSKNNANNNNQNNQAGTNQDIPGIPNFGNDQSTGNSNQNPGPQFDNNDFSDIPGMVSGNGKARKSRGGGNNRRPRNQMSSNGPSSNWVLPSILMMVAVLSPQLLIFLLLTLASFGLSASGLAGVGGIVQAASTASIIWAMIATTAWYVALFFIGYLIKRLLFQSDQSVADHLDNLVGYFRRPTMIMFSGVGIIVGGILVTIALTYLFAVMGDFSLGFISMFSFVMLAGVIIYAIGIVWSLVVFMIGSWAGEPNATFGGKWIAAILFIVIYLVAWFILQGFTASLTQQMQMQSFGGNGLGGFGQ